MSEVIIDKIRELSEEACKKDTNVFGYGIWSHHVVYVAKYGKLLAERLGADQEVVEIASLLHDYASIKDVNKYKEHHIHGATEAEQVLSSLDYSYDKIEKVKSCILSHRSSVELERLSLEEICVASADAMAHIDQVVSLLYLVYKEKNMTIDEGKKWVKDKIERSWRKLDEVARSIIRDKYNCALKILE